MSSYEVKGIKERRDYSFALKSIHEEIGDIVNSGEGDGKKRTVKLEYDNKKGILTFSTNVDINPFELNLILAEKGLELKALEE